MKESKSLLFFYIAWLVAAIATLGSMFFSEVMKYTPCSMCWYQRIAMYPLVMILLIGAWKSIKETTLFATPFVLIGWLIALYHNLLHYKIIPESAAPCVQGVPCSTIYINWFGFITIPILSLTAFTIIGVLLILEKRNRNHA